MNKSILNSAVMAAIAISITACSSGGGSDVAGIGGSGITSSGTITGFGSIIVNGVKYDDSTATVTIDDNPSSRDLLELGMRVTVTGTDNGDGTGTATSVTFDDQLQGPISGMPVSGVIDENLDQTVKTFRVLGTTVIASSADTVFDVSGTNAANPPTYTYGDLTIGHNIEISGFFNTNGELEATRIELKDAVFSTSNIVEIRGSITSVNNTDIVVNGVNVDASSPSEGIDNLPNGLVLGAFVEVKGTCADSSCNPVTATKVEGESEGFDSDGDYEVEGLVTEFTNLANNFKVADLPVDASQVLATNFEPASLQSTIDNDMKVEVEGTVVGGVLIANEVKLRGGDNKIEGRVSSVPLNNQFEVEVDRGDNETVTIIVSAETEVEDDVNDNKFFKISDLQVNNFVEVRGFADASNNVTASQVKLTNSDVTVAEDDDYILQGVITDLTGDANSGTVTVLGVTMPYIGGSNSTDFEDKDDNPVNFTTFSGLITTGQTIVKIKDKKDAPNAIGTADEIEIELP